MLALGWSAQATPTGTVRGVNPNGFGNSWRYVWVRTLARRATPLSGVAQFRRGPSANCYPGRANRKKNKRIPSDVGVETSACESYRGDIFLRHISRNCRGFSNISLLGVCLGSCLHVIRSDRRCWLSHPRFRRLYECARHRIRPCVPAIRVSAHAVRFADRAAAHSHFVRRKWRAKRITIAKSIGRSALGFPSLRFDPVRFLIS